MSQPTTVSINPERSQARTTRTMSHHGNEDIIQTDSAIDCHISFSLP